MADETTELYHVYHALSSAAMLYSHTDEWLSGHRNEHYMWVAEVNAPLHDVFEITNHHSGNWTERDEVIYSLNADMVRSTSVGDIILNVRTQEAWLVVPMGLKLIVAKTT